MHETLRPFHLAIPVTDLEKAKIWYRDKLGCSFGRETSKWVDFNFFGHQLVAHLVNASSKSSETNMVDGQDVPSRHFGIILTLKDWDSLAQRLKKKNVHFLLLPQTRFRGEAGEQSTFFIEDPFGNALEFKSFRDDFQIFTV